MHTQVVVFRILWAAAGALALFVLVHSAMAAFTQSAGVLTQTLH